MDQILGGYREHAATETGIAVVPGRVLGSDLDEILPVPQPPASPAAVAALARYAAPGRPDGLAPG